MASVGRATALIALATSKVCSFLCRDFSHERSEVWVWWVPSARHAHASLASRQGNVLEGTGRERSTMPADDADAEVYARCVLRMRRTIVTPPIIRALVHALLHMPTVHLPYVCRAQK